MSYKNYKKIVSIFEKRVDIWQSEYADLVDTIEKINLKEVRRTPYKVENSVVFNKNLKEIGTVGPKYILVADNPGMDEQKNCNSCYLIGKAGKMARNFFINNGLVKDFDKEVVVLNKSCIHTHSTKDLKKLKEFSDLVSESQVFMADMAIDIQKLFKCDVWIVGCSELKKRGLFEPYLNRLKERYSDDAQKLEKKIFFYPHFSYGNFNKNLNSVLKDDPELEIKTALTMAGKTIL